MAYIYKGFFADSIFVVLFVTINGDIKLMPQMRKNSMVTFTTMFYSLICKY